MREPQKIVAAIEIAGALRSEIANQLDQHRPTGWDTDVLMIELGRLLGAVVRSLDAPPSMVDCLVGKVRAVHAGLLSTQPPDAEDAVRELCPASASDAEQGESPDDRRQVQ